MKHTTLTLQKLVCKILVTVGETMGQPVNSTIVDPHPITPSKDTLTFLYYSYPAWFAFDSRKS
jgi:hypothetical protein